VASSRAPARVVVTATSAPHTEVFDATSEIAIERIPRRRFSFPRGARNGPSKRRSPVTSPIWSCWIRRGRSVCWAPSSPFPTASSCTVRSDGARTNSNRGFVDSLRVEARRRRDLRRVVSGVRGATHHRGVRAANYSGAAGVDTTRFTPLDPSRRTEVRQSLGLDEHAFLVSSFSRLVPRKEWTP